MESLVGAPRLDDCRIVGHFGRVPPRCTAVTWKVADEHYPA